MVPSLDTSGAQTSTTSTSCARVLSRTTTQTAAARGGGGRRRRLRRRLCEWQVGRRGCQLQRIVSFSTFSIFCFRVKRG